MKVEWQIRKFEEFSLKEFHDLIQLRIEVFVLEHVRSSFFWKSADQDESKRKGFGS